MTKDKYKITIIAKDSKTFWKRMSEWTTTKLP